MDGLVDPSRKVANHPPAPIYHADLIRDGIDEPALWELRVLPTAFRPGQRVSSPEFFSTSLLLAFGYTRSSNNQCDRGFDKEIGRALNRQMVILSLAVRRKVPEAG